MALDGASQRPFVSHGFTASGRFDDTWSVRSTGAWQEDSPAGARPGARCLPACAYGVIARALLLYGGQDNSSAQLGDTWVLPDGVLLDGVLLDGAWHAVVGVGPPARRFPAMAAVAGSAWLFGGAGAEGSLGDL